MPKQKKKSSKQSINWAELIAKGLIDFIVALAVAWITKYLL